MESLKRRSGSASKPSSVMSSCSFVLSRSRMTTFSPNCAGTVETRRSRSRERSSTRSRILIRPSCGRRFSEMSSFAMIFKREMSGSRVRMGRAMMLWRMPSIRKRTRNSFSYGSTWMSEAPALRASMRMRLETLMIGADSVDLARSPRSISWPSSCFKTSTSAPSSSPVISSMFISPNPTPAMSSAVRAEVCMTSSRLPPPGWSATEGFAFSFSTTERGVPGDDRLPVVPRHELDVVHGEHVRGIAHRDRQRRARLVHGENDVLAGDFRGHDLDDVRIDLEAVQVDGRHAELVRERLGNLRFGNRLDADQSFAELAPLVPLGLQGGVELVLSDQLRFEKEIPEFNCHVAGGSE